MKIDLPPELSDVLKMLAKAGVLGMTPQQVGVHLVRRAIDDLVTSQYTQKCLETRDLLRRRVRG